MVALLVREYARGHRILSRGLRLPRRRGHADGATALDPDARREGGAELVLSRALVIRQPSSASKRAGACSCSCTPPISTATSPACEPRTCGSPRRHRSESYGRVVVSRPLRQPRRRSSSDGDRERAGPGEPQRVAGRRSALTLASTSRSSVARLVTPRSTRCARTSPRRADRGASTCRGRRA